MLREVLGYYDCCAATIRVVLHVRNVAERKSQNTSEARNFMKLGITVIPKQLILLVDGHYFE